MTADHPATIAETHLDARAYCQMVGSMAVKASPERWSRHGAGIIRTDRLAHYGRRLPQVDQLDPVTSLVVYPYLDARRPRPGA